MAKSKFKGSQKVLNFITLGWVKETTPNKWYMQRRIYIFTKRESKEY